MDDTDKGKNCKVWILKLNGLKLLTNITAFYFVRFRTSLSELKTRETMLL